MSNMTILVILYYFQGLENSLESKEETSYFNKMYVCIISAEKNVSRAREIARMVASVQATYTQRGFGAHEITCM